jgi:hypothetical protein
VVGVLVTLPFVPHRRVCLPVLCRLWQPQQHTKSKKPKAARQPKQAIATQGKCALARQLVEQIAGRYPDRQVHLVGDVPPTSAGPGAARPSG